MTVVVPKAVAPINAVTRLPANLSTMQFASTLSLDLFKPLSFGKWTNKQIVMPTKTAVVNASLLLLVLFAAQVTAHAIRRKNVPEMALPARQTSSPKMVTLPHTLSVNIG